MKPVYKQVKIPKEHCPKCGEILTGNNSYVTPWQCRCGVWRAESKYPWNGEYIVEKIIFH